MNTGCTLWFTGLSGSGKSTLSQLVASRLRNLGAKVEVLDGDIVRTLLCQGLGFSREDREENIRRIDTKPRAKKQTHGFQVHFLRGDRVVTRMFSDNVYGGKPAARRAARKFKRSMLRRLPRRKFLG